MLTKYKDVKPKIGVKSPLKKFSYLQRIQEIFSGRGYQIRHIFKSVFFSGRAILKNIDNKKGTRGSAGLLPRKMFENLHTAVAILVLFEQFLGKFC